MVSRERWPRLDPERGVADVTLLILEWLGEQGIGATIRIDAERLAEGRPPWTFAAGGGAVGTGMRADGRTAEECMGRALVPLSKLGVDVPF
ncbi:hypothetical protein GCM10010329_30940 [Streptomyces spiroverticillatus]|uniref:Uncharacterized protein n=1 Tax=Streptomyces finlayi TaxID=67296 RepID=A0A918WW74_9ACTN|nr:hypothetical protein [Streptomyces finlayi]GHA06207.1 hypothetical protein GCM10010329_30940 [Streptomyces spiroverticillatus]GHC89849.1 hypothetical protein GCM10010334_23350 [Streptomyces finlayi]